MSLSGRDSIPQEGAPANNERRNTRVKRAVRISSIVAQEVSVAVSGATCMAVRGRGKEDHRVCEGEKLSSFNETPGETVTLTALSTSP
ncbi:hypothetical protein MATL_G00036450 [Megalops atlanticus]|uniref:Uncharacterized protein n=1 Tax=Megalops atlanticus TaxID=7932 RepID=A0A9D3QDX1_MEGAT|nr:hypothetical protein MATL_G00036450 [Megalops atlanticus]